MPIYEYLCRKCGARFEKIVPNRQTEPDCPECGGHQVEKQLSTFSAVVHESGGCPSRKHCPSASAGGCGCAGACGHHHNH